MISVIFEVIGNLFLSKYILIKTINDTINYEAIFNQKEQVYREYGMISLGSSLVRNSL